MCSVYDGVYTKGGERDAGGEEEDFGRRIIPTNMKFHVRHQSSTFQELEMANLKTS